MKIKLNMGNPGPRLRQLYEREDRACLNSDCTPEMFDPDPSDKETIRRAVKICRSCPVQQLCLIAQLEHGIRHQHGIWGGMLPSRRKTILRMLGFGASDAASTK